MIDNIQYTVQSQMNPKDVVCNDSRNGRILANPNGSVVRCRYFRMPVVFGTLSTTTYYIYCTRYFLITVHSPFMRRANLWLFY